MKNVERNIKTKGHILSFWQRLLQKKVCIKVFFVKNIFFETKRAKRAEWVKCVGFFGIKWVCSVECV